MSALLQQLTRFSSSDKTWHGAPFSIRINRTVWSVATDGHILFGIKVPGGTPSKDYPDKLKDLLTDPPVSPIEVSVLELRAWAGEVPSARVPSDPVDPEHQGVLLNRSIDRRKLAYLMAKVNLPNILMWATEGNILVFEPPKAQWRAILAALDDPPEPDEPVFGKTKPVEALSANELMDLVGGE